MTNAVSYPTGLTGLFYRSSLYAAVACGFLLGPQAAFASDWLTLPSTYTHDQQTGARVNQFAQVQAPAVPAASNFRTSGYTHTRSSLNYGQSADNYHRVERWGDPVRPYGEWRFPFRPYSTPYPNWGAPYAGLNLGLGGIYGGVFQRAGPYASGFGGRPGVNPGYQPGMPRGGYIGRPAVPGVPQSGERPLRRVDPSFSNPLNSNPLNPYPAGPGTPYPVAPYYDGYHPNYRD